MTSVTLHHHICQVCGHGFGSRRKDASTCSDVCRQWKARRKSDHERRAVDVGHDIMWLLKSYQVGAMTHDMARAIVRHIELNFEEFRLAVEAEQLRRMLEES